MINLDKIIAQANLKKASDIHLMVDSKPIFRIGNALVKMETEEILTNEDLYEIYNYITKENLPKKKISNEKKSKNVVYKYKEMDLDVNISFANKVPTYTMKILRNELPLYEDLNIPDVVRKMTHQTQGMILVAGTKKTGKTTTLNALVRHINETQNKKVITLEKSIEFKNKSRSSIIVQKQIGEEKDFLTYYDGAKNVLEEDCDIVVIGEIKDKRTMQVAFEIAESGRLVIGGLNTNSCTETVEKITNFYSEDEQNEIKYLMATQLKLIISQRLVLGTKEKVELVPEVLVIDNKTSEIIKKGKNCSKELKKVIHNSQENGNISIVNSIAKLFVEDKLTLKQAKAELDEEDREILHKIIMKMRIKKG